MALKLARHASTPTGKVRHLTLPNGERYSEFIPGYGTVDITEAYVKRWIYELVNLHYKQEELRKKYADVPPLFVNGMPYFISSDMLP